MKKVLVISLLMLFAFVGTTWSQVIIDFEDGTTQGYADNGWGPGFTSVTNAADPSGLSTGSLALAYNGAGADTKGDIQIDNLDVSAAQVLMYWVWLPADCPDGLTIKLWAQDNANWKWTEQAYNTTGMPRETWYPITFDLDAKTIASETFDHRSNKLGKSGIEIGNWGVADKAWAGTIYVDNISMVGAEPNLFADFEDGTTGGFADNGWGPGFTEVANADNPAGDGKVLAITYNGAGADTKGDLQIDGIDPAGTQMFVYWVWLPADAPDGLTLKLWAQDNAHWKWSEQSYNSTNIPNAIWFPIYFNMEARHAEKPAEFDHKNNKLGKSGIEIGNWGVADKSWSGTIYLDNASFVGLETGKKWVFADWENVAAGLQGFINTGWGPALTDIFQDEDPTDLTDGVMWTTWDFALGQKGALETTNVPLTDAQTGDVVTQITVEVYIPEDMPEGIQVGLYLRGSAVASGWTEDAVLTGNQLIIGQWNTLLYDVQAHIDAGEVDPTKSAIAGFQLYFGQTSDWFGDVYWDNLTLVGITKPEGSLASPQVTATPQVFVGANEGDGVVVNYEFAHIQWVDNTVGTETYNVYKSKSPIDDLTAEGVIRIATKVPHGEQQWGHRAWTRAGSEETWYYAVTSVGSDGMETELNDQCKAGPVTIVSTPTAKAQYVADFASKFTLDGLDGEFADYKVNTIQGESAGGAEGMYWDLESTDLNFSATFVIDDNNLYISADVTDDDLREPPGQAWEGDALEFYMGFYNVNLLDALHPYQSVGQEGTDDWRIGFTAWGTLQLNATQETTVDGIESTVFEKFSGDGYIIEAKLDLKKLTNGKINIADGTMLPCRVDGNDMDPANGDASRTLIVQFGGAGGVCHEDWKRPSTWGYLEVLGGPVAVEDENVADIPTEFKLSGNYPNPFNPSTTLRYQLPKTAEVSIVVYDVLGKEVKTLVQGQQPAGFHALEWDGTNQAGINVPSGIYFVKMISTEYTHTQKMMLLK